MRFIQAFWEWFTMQGFRMHQRASHLRSMGIDARWWWSERRCVRAVRDHMIAAERQQMTWFREQIENSERIAQSDAVSAQALGEVERPAYDSGSRPRAKRAQSQSDLDKSEER